MSLTLNRWLPSSVVLLTLGCGGTTEAVDDAGSVELCGTSAFTARQSGGGPVVAGSQVLREVGFRLVTIDTSCAFLTFDGTSTGLGEGREGFLDPTLKEEAESLLQLNAWRQLDAEAEFGRDNTGGVYEMYEMYEMYAIGDRRIGISSFGEPPPPEFLPGSLIAELVEMLRPHSRPVRGPVRYMLIAPNGGGLRDDAYRNAPSWPLSESPESVALTEAQGSREEAEATQVTGEDADALRGLRRAFSNGEIGQRDLVSFIPIEELDGSRYQLFVRDLIE